MKVKSHLFVDMRGTLGTDVASKWRSINYVRAEPLVRKNPKTEKQIAVRTKFVFVQGVLRPLKGYIRVAFKVGERKQSEFNAAYSYNYKNAVTGVYPNYAIDYAELQVGHGSLENVENARATVTTTGLTVTWRDHSAGREDVNASDYVMPLVYNVDKNDCQFAVADFNRDAQTLTMTLPTAWSGDTIEVYLCCRTADGKEASDSIYLGEYTAM